ncbi:uncharacterized protein LOC134191172 [Corticium candelabrum]|uniref:uncharacterized protein LOC134191172 n=1 Tax=Corticium candelabrum TaxID=121492 RepID=UPI002E273C63|nr:uncharacterized protein LOC134191172 [Corticium candelabrum]
MRGERVVAVVVVVLVSYGVGLRDVHMWRRESVDETPNLTTIDNGIVSVGVDSNRGGSITYFSVSHRNENVINVYDMGREVQMSFYGGPDDYEPSANSDRCKSKWRPQGNWPWNPIGAGDVSGNSGEVLDLQKDDETHEIYVKSRPLQWSCQMVPCECTFEKLISLDGPAVNVHAKLVNNRSDHTSYPAHGQELPAVYTTGSFYRIFTYNGTKPFTHDELTEFNTTGKIWTPGQFLATESWAALVNDSLWGLGVFQPYTNLITGGFAGPHGNYGPHSGSTGYLAPNQIEILDYNIIYQFNFSIILGSLQEIRQYVYDKSSRRQSCLDYAFTIDREHFRYENAADAGQPKGSWHIFLEQNDPQIIGPACVWMAEDHPTLYINASYSTNLGPNNTAQVFFNADGRGAQFDEQHSVSFPIQTDNHFHQYAVDLSSSLYYKGAMYGIRFDPVPSGKAGAYVEIAKISVRLR